MRIEWSQPCNIIGVCVTRVKAARQGIKFHSNSRRRTVNMLLHIVSSFRLFVIYKLLSCMFAVGSILKVVPFFKCFILRAFEAVSGERLPPSTYWNSLFEQKMLDNIWHSILTDTQKKVKLGCRASNPPVVSTDGKRCFTLLDMSRNGRPLVMSFGSCTCPIFMNRLKEFRKLITDFGHIVDFLVIYIEEAHPADGWAFKVREFYFLKC